MGWHQHLLRRLFQQGCAFTFTVKAAARKLCCMCGRGWSARSALGLRPRREERAPLGRSKRGCQRGDHHLIHHAPRRGLSAGHWRVLILRRCCKHPWGPWVSGSTRASFRALQLCTACECLGSCTCCCLQVCHASQECWIQCDYANIERFMQQLHVWFPADVKRFDVGRFAAGRMPEMCAQSYSTYNTGLAYTAGRASSLAPIPGCDGGDSPSTEQAHIHMLCACGKIARGNLAQ